MNRRNSRALAQPSPLPLTQNHNPDSKPQLRPKSTHNPKSQPTNPNPNPNPQITLSNSPRRSATAALPYSSAALQQSPCGSSNWQQSFQQPNLWACARPNQMHRVQLVLVLVLRATEGRPERGGATGTRGADTSRQEPRLQYHTPAWLSAQAGVLKQGGLRSKGPTPAPTPAPKRDHTERVSAHGALDKLELHRRGDLHPVAEVNSSRCKQWHMMHVPKTGGSLMSEFITRFRPNPDRLYCNGRVQLHDHTQLYMPCSFATLREPCSRVVSSYAHLRHVYNKTRGLGKFVRQICQAKTVNEYVVALHAHWREIFNRNITTWPARDRHLVLAMPQHLWIGNASKVICTDRLDELLPATLRGMGCHAVPNSTTVVKGVAGSGNKYTAMSGKLSAEQANLSTASCAAVRKLYRQDWFLYQRQCLGGPPSAQ